MKDPTVLSPYDAIATQKWYERGIGTWKAQHTEDGIAGIHSDLVFRRIAN